MADRLRNDRLGSKPLGTTPSRINDFETGGGHNPLGRAGSPRASQSFLESHEDAGKSFQRSMKGNPAVDKVVEIFRGTPGKLQDTFETVRRQGSERAGEWGRIAKDRYADARRRAQRTVNEKPIHTLAALAGLAFILGIALRLSKRRSY